MNKTFRIVAAGAVLFLSIVGFLILGHGSTSRAALAKYKAELRAKGEKLSFAELAISSPYGRSDWNSNLFRLTTKLGNSRPVFQPWQTEARKFTKAATAKPFWLEDAPGPANNPGKKSVSWEQFENEMENNDGTMEELRRLATEPVAENRGRTNSALAVPFVPNFVAIRTAGLWLVGDAECKLHQNRLPEALDDLEAIVGLTERYRDEYLLVSQMIRVAVANLGLVVTWDALQSPQWTESQLANLQHAWETIDLLDPVERGFTGERASSERFWDMSRTSGSQAKQMMQSVRRSSTDGILKGLFEDFVLVPAYNVTSINDDELFYLKSMQAALQAIRAVKLNEPWSNIKTATDKQIATISRLAGTPQKFRYLRSLMALPNYCRATQTALRAETERQMTVIAIALRRYQLIHGQTAASLNALVPEFLTVVPIDHMSGMPFRYKVSGDIDFLLYSVGEDGIDDGGDATPGKGFWDGHDAVWPRAENRQKNSE